MSDSKLSQYFGLPRAKTALLVDAFRLSGVTVTSALEPRDPSGEVEPWAFWLNWTLVTNIDGLPPESLWISWLKLFSWRSGGKSGGVLHLGTGWSGQTHRSTVPLSFWCFALRGNLGLQGCSTNYQERGYNQATARGNKRVTEEV